MYDMSSNTIIGDYGRDIVVYPETPRIPKDYQNPDKLGVHVFSRAHIHPFTVRDYYDDPNSMSERQFQSVDHYLAYLTAKHGLHAKRHSKKALKIAKTINNKQGYYKRLIRKLEPRFVMSGDGLTGRENRLSMQVPLLKDAYKAKFTAPECTHLRGYLVRTGSAILVEDVPHDTYWGTGHRTNSKRFKEMERWNGYNFAGKTLMDVRDTLT